MRIDPSTLTNICQVAAERFLENAKELRKFVDYKPPATEGLAAALIPHGDGARFLAEQFELQAKQAREYADYLADADSIKVIE